MDTCYTDRIDSDAADVFVIRRYYRDGVTVVLGCYRTERDARAELRLIREAR